MLSKNQFEVLDALRREPSASQRDVAASSGLSLGTVNSTLKSLQEEGLAEGGKPTPAGMEALAPYKVDNAVILAAGLSSRFAPISYEKPKGVLRVRGEVLIERQIEQLREAGITDITVVVGYKKEYFFYLRKKYGVTLVNNDEYASRNNNGSLWRVRGRLGNTYVCSSDDYFTQNPFNAYVFKAYYSAQYAEGPTKEWCMETGAGGRITKVTVGGSNSWYMLGHVYFDRAFSERFVLPLSHDEVVHMKGSLRGKMPGDDWRQLAGVRSFWAYMLCHPGKKLLFMGSELPQWHEWDFRGQLDWYLLDDPACRASHECLRQLNRLYERNRCLWENDRDWDGFTWLVADDNHNNVLVFLRRDRRGHELICAVNFAPVPWDNYRFGVPAAARYEVLFNTDDACWGGSGCALPAGSRIDVDEIPSHGRETSLSLTIPPLGAVLLRREGKRPRKKQNTGGTQG